MIVRSQCTFFLSWFAEMSETIFIELMTSDRELMASRKSSK